MVGRIIAIICVYYGSLLYFKKQTIKFGELMFIAYGGMIRGAIAFALVMKIPHIGAFNCKVPDFCFTKEEYDLAVSTTLALVMITTLLFGTFMKAASKWLTMDPNEEKKPEPNPVKKPSLRQSETATVRSHYEVLMHPNLEVNEPESAGLPPEEGPKAFKNSDFVKWFTAFDTEVIMPLFVRNYSKYMAK